MLVFNPLIFICRRLFFSLTVVFTPELVVLQLGVQLLLSTFIIAYLVMYRPYKDARMERLELFNEVTFVAMTYSLACFSDLVPDAETRSYVGYSFIAFAVINVIIHLFFVLKHTLTTLKNKICRRCIRRQRE